jgi:hypothetical protein
MSDDTYANYLDRGWDEIPEPVVLPGGTWTLQCKGVSFKKGDAGKSDVFLFNYIPVSPGADVDEDALDSLGADYDFAMNRIFKRFFISETQDLKRLRDHMLRHQGFRMPEGTIAEHMENIKPLRTALDGTMITAELVPNTYTNSSGDLIENNEVGRVFDPSDD